jgi:OmpA-OmpF porin, OOP family
MKKQLLIYIFFLFANTIFAQKASSLEEESTELETAFARGNKILFQDNFEKDALGDFPARWVSNLGGELKKLKGFEEKYLKVPAKAVINLIQTKPFPKNFTLEFDVILPADQPYACPGFNFGEKVESGMSFLLAPRKAIHFDILKSDRSGYKNQLRYGTFAMNNSLKKIDFTPASNQKTHWAFEVNDTRIRLFIDGKKQLDLPGQYLPIYSNQFYFSSVATGWAESKESYFYISNFVLAETVSDVRSKIIKELLEKGSISTNAIQFEVNSDKILPESESTIMQFADALKENTDLKLKIIGHTDSDGDDAKNLILSKKRAVSVKTKLVALGINAARLNTDGKGETQPIGDNKTAAGKAENRRVEFIKMN